MSYKVRVHLFPIEKKDILKYLDDREIKYNDYFKQYLNHDKYKSVTEDKDIEVIILKIEELGLTRPSSFNQIKKAAIKKGYKFCDANLGFYLRLCLKEQRMSSDSIFSQGKNPDSSINIFTDKFEEEWTFPRNTYLRNVDGQLWLRASRFDDLYEFEISSEFAFML